MLKRWSIENFKSFAGRTDILLAPITVFAGANSSGKSTIIQSMLLLKQTVQYAPVNRPLALNGPLLKLGTFDDILNSGSPRAHVGVSWEMDVEDLSQQRPSAEFFSPPFFYFGRMNIKNISGEFKWDVTPTIEIGPSVNAASAELLQLYPRLVSSELTAVTAQSEPRLAELVLSRAPQDHPSEKYLFKVANIDEASLAEVSSKAESKIVGARVRHFFPAAVAVRFNSTRNRARLMSLVICGEDVGYTYQAREFAKIEISATIAEEIASVLLGEQYASKGFFPSIDSKISVEQLGLRIRRHRTALRSHTSSVEPPRALSELRKEVEEILIRDQDITFEVEFAYPDIISEGSQYASQYFVSAVRYLGPLRDEPKPIYPLEALANPTEVGFKGEHTAAVLDLHRERTIRYLPSSFITGDKLNLDMKYVTLHDAVVDWLNYVGVASEIVTSDRGKVGHQLQVQTEGLVRFHDLTNVGVGVSQVLPIIVMALLAEPPTILIFEQPELHLHPKVQARLADFFLSVALIGKQCLLETHSEYLIDRFRHRVAAASGDSLLDILKIYFTEREQGTTKCREVRVSRYGAIPDWPKDFFEQSQIETESILKAAAAKRRSENKPG